MGNAGSACRSALVLALALAWPAGAHATDKNVAQAKTGGAPGAGVIEWVVPWRDGMALRYATEDYDVDIGAGGRESTRTSGIDVVRITEARADGYLQVWSFEDARYDVIEGDREGAAAMQGMLESLSDMVLEVELDAAGNYAGIRNLDAVAARMRPVMKQMILAGVDAGKTAADGDAAGNVEARAAGMALVDGMVERFTAPEVLAPVLSEDAVRYNDLVGAELEDGREYEVDIELPNPVTGGVLPARTSIGAYVRASEPDDVFIEWTTRPDPVKAAEAAALAAGKLFEEEVAAAVREQVQALSIIDSGFVLFRRSTGVLELLEATRTTRADGVLKVERRRMRLLDGDHDHAWADQGPPTPAEQPAAID